MKKLLYLLILMALSPGCAPVISRDALDLVDPDITFADLQNDPAGYRGKTVLLGGVIVNTSVEEDGTLLEIYQTALDRLGEPIHLDRSQGRFLAFYDGFLDSEIWRKGRKVTIAGTVEGEKTGKLGNLQYRYPYLRVREIHLWEERIYRYEPYPWYPWGPPGPWSPWWDPWWDPFWYPYWGPYPHYRLRHR